MKKSKEEKTRLEAVAALKDVAMTYLRLVADLLDRSPEYCSWVGADEKEGGVYDVADFGDTAFLTFDQMQVIIFELPRWVAKYGGRKQVAQTVRDWCDWCVEEGNFIDGHPRINLKNWLMGSRE